MFRWSGTLNLFIGCKKYKIEEQYFFSLFFRRKILFYHFFSQQTIIKLSSLRVSNCHGTSNFFNPSKKRTEHFALFIKMLFFSPLFQTKLPGNSLLCESQAAFFFTPSRKYSTSHALHLQVRRHSVKKKTLSLEVAGCCDASHVSQLHCAKVHTASVGVLQYKSLKQVIN